MLDKSVPYVKVFMKRPCIYQNEFMYTLPEGYSFTFYESGDELAWGEIEWSVGEFDSIAEATEKFSETYLQQPEEAKKRILFIQTAEGKKVATATAWWDHTHEKRHPRLHWVAVHNEYQGKGLGRAIIGRIVEEMEKIEGKQDFYLSTQTWSHKAIKLYEKVGFAITDELEIGNKLNDQVEEAKKILKNLNP